MLNYRQRFKNYYQSLNNLFEDLLVFTIGIPLIIVLNSWNNFLDNLRSIPYVPNSLVHKLWNMARILLFVPVYTLKGALALTLAPLLSLGLAFKPQSQPLFTYQFQIGNVLTKKFNFHNYWLQFSLMRMLFAIFPERLIPLLSLRTLILLFPPILATLKFTRQGTPIHSTALLLLMSSTIPYYANSFIILFSLYSPALLCLTPFSAAMASALSIASLGLWLEGINQLISNRVISWCSYIAEQVYFFAWKKNYTHYFSYQNNIDLLGQNIKEIPAAQLFITDNYYVLNLENMLDGFSAQGAFFNYMHGSCTLTSEDVLRLAKHPGLRQFPDLKQYIDEHQQQFLASNHSIISIESLNEIEGLANVMSTPQDQADFTEKMATAQEHFEQYCNRRSAEEQEAIKQLNLLGQEHDPRYQLQSALTYVYQGSWCKAGVSSLMMQTVQQVRQHGQQTLEESNIPLWHSHHPQHPMQLI